MKVANVILAAGFGTRMKSSLPKVMHPLVGRPMVEWTVRMAEAVTQRPPVVVVGHGRELVEAHLGDRALYVFQEELLGTGHAVQQAVPVLRGEVDAVIVSYADMPQLRSQTVQKLVDTFQAARTEDERTALAMLTVTRDDPQGFGRVIRTDDGEIEAIIEEVDCTPEQRAIKELNPGVYCFDAAWLFDNLDKIPMSPKGEYYLTDMVGIATDQGLRVVGQAAPAEDVDGVNNRVQLAQATNVLRARIVEAHMLNGVTVIDPTSTYIEDTVTIGQDTTIWPNCYLRGQTVIGADAEIGPNSQIVDSQVGDGCRVVSSLIEEARMEADCEIGPFGHLRKGAHLAEGVHMGNFGEVKNSYLGSGVKMGHFSYIGDSHVAENVNIGAGTITCNFDGKQKNKTVIGADAFIGSGTMLVAPVEIGAGGRIGAGSVVTHDVAANSLVYGVPARPAKPAAESEAESVDASAQQ